MSGELITIYWRDIPAQVTARSGRVKASVQLSDRFQIAIDKAAVRAGKHTTNDYLEEWRRESEPCGADLQLAVDEAATRLETEFTADVLDQLVASGGLRPGAKEGNGS
ncbi:MAG: virulence factor [Acidimicrobiia bacterium]|nr:virulence factor [Acidimicrobiia bacterium]